MFRFAVLVSFLSAALFGAESRVQMKDLPAAVQKTVREQTQNAKLTGLSKEVERGKTNYEAETTINGKSRDVLIDPAGAIIEVEEAIDPSAVPAAVQKAFQQRAGSSGKILKVESVTRGSTVSYEAVIRKGGRRSEVAVNADGSSAKEE